jgi:hypothetical protein
MVLTPSGAIACVIRIQVKDGQEIALVEWSNGETCNFQVKLLTRIPKKEANDGP